MLKPTAKMKKWCFTGIVVLAFLTIGISPAIAVDTESTIKAAESEWKLINQNK